MHDEANSFQDGKYLTAKAKGLLVGVVVVIGFLFIIGAFNQIKTPGSHFEKSEYSGKFYVLVFPDKNGAKNYKLPAELDRVCVEDGDGGCGHGYDVNSIIFPNGGSPSFQDCHPDLHTKTRCTADDDDSSDFYIQLTSEKVK